MVSILFKAFGFSWPYVREMFVDIDRSKKKTRTHPQWLRTGLAGFGLASALLCPWLGYEWWKSARALRQVKPCPTCTTAVQPPPAEASACLVEAPQPTASDPAPIKKRTRPALSRPSEDELKQIESKVNANH